MSNRNEFLQKLSNLKKLSYQKKREIEHEKELYSSTIQEINTEKKLLEDEIQRYEIMKENLSRVREQNSIRERDCKEVKVQLEKYKQAQKQTEEKLKRGKKLFQDQRTEFIKVSSQLNDAIYQDSIFYDKENIKNEIKTKESELMLAEKKNTDTDVEGDVVMTEKKKTTEEKSLKVEKSITQKLLEQKKLLEHKLRMDKQFSEPTKIVEGKDDQLESEKEKVLNMLISERDDLEKKLQEAKEKKKNSKKDIDALENNKAQAKTQFANLKCKKCSANLTLVDTS